MDLLKCLVNLYWNDEYTIFLYNTTNFYINKIIKISNYVLMLYGLYLYKISNLHQNIYIQLSSSQLLNSKNNTCKMVCSLTFNRFYEIYVFATFRIKYS